MANHVLDSKFLGRPVEVLEWIDESTFEGIYLRFVQDGSHLFVRSESGPATGEPETTEAAQALRSLVQSLIAEAGAFRDEDFVIKWGVA